MAEFTILKRSSHHHHDDIGADDNDDQQNIIQFSDSEHLNAVVQRIDVDDDQQKFQMIEKIYLPPEILIEILGYLDFDSIVMTSIISRGFYDVHQTDELWTKLLNHDWKPLKEKSTNIDTTTTATDNSTTTAVQNNVPATHSSSSSSASYELVDCSGGDDDHDHDDHPQNINYERYKERYLRYKKWRNSIAFIYSEERKQYTTQVVDHEQAMSGRRLIGYLKYLLTFPILFYRLLIFLFISQDEQPDFGLTHEIEYIQEKSLRAGGSLLLLILFLPMLLSSWLIGELPVTPAFATLHIILKIIFTVLCFGSHFYNRMEKTIEHYREANWLSVMIILTSGITLVLMRFVDDFITCCLVAFQMSTALGLAISLKHMIKNTENVESLFESTTSTTPHYLLPIFECFRNRPFATNMILTDLIIIIIMIGGFKTFLFLVALITIVVLGGDLGNLPTKDLLDGRTGIFFVVVAASIIIFFLASVIVGGNYKIKSRARNTIAIILLVLLTLSFIVLMQRVFSIYFGYSKRWKLSLFEFVEETASTSSKTTTTMKK